jgi:DoxX-like protein
MPSDTQTATASRKKLWAGRVISAIPVLLLLFSGVMKLTKAPSVMQGFAGYGYPESLIVVIGLLEIACTVVYAIPRTSMIGAILLTGYLGGATATNVRVGNPAFIMTTILGVLAWLGLFLRDDRLRALIPLRK